MEKNKHSYGVVSTLCSFLVSMLLLPLILAILLIFGSLRQTVGFILKQRLGKDFAGLIKGSDIVYTIEDQSKCIVNCLAIFECPFEDYIQFKTAILKIFQEILQPNPVTSKFFYTRHVFCGYNYFSKKPFRIEDCLKVVHFEDEAIEESQVQEVLSANSNTSLPFNNTGLWQVIICDKPVVWKNNHQKKKPKFALIFRFQHCLGDGLSFMQSVLLDGLSDSGSKAKATYHKKWTNLNTKPTLTTNIKKIFSSLWAVVSLLHIATLKLHFRPADINKLSGVELSGDKILVWASEDQPLLISKVKNIKEKISDGTKFLDVVLAALSASVSDFFARDGGIVPKSASAILTLMLALPKNKGDTKMRNTVTMAVLNLPMRSPGGQMLERLAWVKSSKNYLEKSPEFLVIFWILNLFAAFFPVPLLKFLLRLPMCTMIVSNLPGTSKIQVNDELVLKDLICWVPHRDWTGVGFAIITYDNRFEISLIVDKALISNKTDVQQIVDDIFKYIFKLEKEVMELGL